MDQPNAAISRQTSVYADVPNRLIAFLIDAVVLSALLFLAAILMSAIFHAVVRIDPGPKLTVNRGMAIADAVVGTAIGAVYFAGSWVLWRGTPGQRLLRMRLAPVDGTDRISLVDAVRRWLVVGAPIGVAGILIAAAGGIADAVIELALFVWGVIVLVSTARDPMKRGLQDRFAKTVLQKQLEASPRVR